MSGPLDGIVVVDITNFVFGPVATQLLGDMGADVIKVEPPEGDPTRGIGRARHRGMGSFFLNLNRNKRSVVLDLKRSDASEALIRLLATADVLVHNVRPSAARRLGIDYARLRERFPRLVYAAAEGFGSTGRYADRPAYDDIIQGMSGITGLNALANGHPGYVPMLLTDKLCGVYLSSAIAMALMHRERTGRGQAVSVPMFETVTSFNLLEHLADAVHAPFDGEADVPLGYQRVFSEQHRPLPTADGFVCIIANTDAQWQRLFVLFGRPELGGDPRFLGIGMRMANVSALYTIVADHLVQRTTVEWLTALAAADVPAGPANDLGALRADPHLTDRNFFRSFEHPSEGPLLMVDVPIEFSDSPGAVRIGPPQLGQHTAEVLLTLGYSNDEIARLGASA